MADKHKMGKGLDIGTVNLVSAEQNEKSEIIMRKQRNVFIEAPADTFTKNILSKINVPYVVYNKKFFVLGDSAFELANILNKSVRRPMKEGLISPKEVDAVPIMKLLIQSILGKPRQPAETCFYSVPAEPIDSELNVTYHKEVFNKVLQALEYTPKQLVEGHAVVLSELSSDDFTGIGISCGGGMFNVCVSYKAIPCLAFSTARAGDWIDVNVARVLGMKPERAAQTKERGVSLHGPKTREDEAISIYYRELIKYALENIKEKFEIAENMPNFPEPVTVLLSGGTALAEGFVEMVKQELSKIEFPIPIKDVRLAKDPLNAVAKGALRAAMLE